MLLVSALFVLSQLAAIYQEDVEGLWIVSSLLGLAYGGLFGLAPMVVLEWFGLGACQALPSGESTLIAVRSPLCSELGFRLAFPCGGR